MHCNFTKMYYNRKNVCFIYSITCLFLKHLYNVMPFFLVIILFAYREKRMYVCKHPTKFEDCGWHVTLIREQKQNVTDLRTDGQTGPL